MLDTFVPAADDISRRNRVNEPQSASGEMRAEQCVLAEGEPTFGGRQASAETSSPLARDDTEQSGVIRHVVAPLSVNGRGAAVWTERGGDPGFPPLPSPDLGSIGIDSSDNEELSGTVIADFVDARGGDDVLEGGDRNEFLFGGDGNDKPLGRHTPLTLVQDFFANRWRSVKRPSWLTPSRFTISLLTLNTILVSIIAFEYAYGAGLTADVIDTPSSTIYDWPDLTPKSFHVPFGEMFDTISNRPLFNPSRRKIINVSPKKVAPEFEIEDITIDLIGTFLSPTRRAALVRLGTQEQAKWVREREYISSWRVDKILAKRLLLRRFDELRIVELWPRAVKPY